MLWRRVVRDSPVAGRHANGTRRVRTNDISQSGGQRADAHHAATLPARRFVVIPGRRDRLRGSFRVIRRFGHRQMMVEMAIGMHVLRGAGSVLFNVHNAPAVPVLGQAWCSMRGARKCKREGRRQNAEQIGQREQARGHQSPCSGQPCQHPQLRPNMLLLGNLALDSFLSQGRCPTIGKVPDLSLLLCRTGTAWDPAKPTSSRTRVASKAAIDLGYPLEVSISRGERNPHPIVILWLFPRV